jgi:hypothetical protein
MNSWRREPCMNSRQRPSVWPRQTVKIEQFHRGPAGTTQIAAVGFGPLRSTCDENERGDAAAASSMLRV